MDTLTEEIAIRYIKQLLIALQYLHKKCIAHLDIKPENILLAVGDEPRVVLSDFGEAIRLGSVPYQHELTGNAEFAGMYLFCLFATLFLAISKTSSDII